MKVLASLTNRIFLASSLLAVISIAVAVFMVNVRVTRDAENNLRRGLEDAATLLTDWEATLSDNFTLASRLIADSPKLKAAIDTKDPQTVARLAPDFQRLTRADLLIVTGREGNRLAVVGAWPADAVPPQPAPDAAEGATWFTYWPHPDGVLEVVTVPVLLGPQLLGAVSLGFVFDVRRASQLRQMTESEIAFAVRNRVWAATVAREHFPLVATMLHQAGMSQVVIGRDEYVGLAKPLGARVEAGTGWRLAGEGPAAVDLPVANRTPPLPARDPRGARRHRDPRGHRGDWLELHGVEDGHAPARGDHRRHARDGAYRRPHAQAHAAVRPLGRRGRPAPRERRSTRSPTRWRRSSTRPRSGSACLRSAGSRPSSRTRSATRS